MKAMAVRSKVILTQRRMWIRVRKYNNTMLESLELESHSYNLHVIEKVLITIPLINVKTL